MDFDEYDYLEKTVENPELPKEDTTNGDAEEAVKSTEKERSRSSRHRSGDKGESGERRSKRSGEESRDHDRSKEKSRHRSRSREGERERHRSGREGRSKDKEEKNGKERERGDRDREKRERDRDGDKDRERSRRSQSRTEKQRNDVEEREKSRDRELRERDKEREGGRERDRDSNRRYKEKKDDGAEPDADPERDQRTVFAYQICLKADERDVYEFFSRAGKVRDVRLIMDRNSRRSKGVGYIEFYDVMSVPMAIALSGQLLLGLPVMVKPSEAEKNLVQSTTAVVGPGGQIGPYSGGARRLYVGNLHTNIKEEDLRQVFGAFGPVELVQLPVDETGSSKGFGFVQFARLEDARNSLSLNGQIDIGGRTIKVSAVTDQVPDAGGNTGDFDDDEGGGLALNARSRALLMQKLDRTGTATNIAGSLVAPVVNNNGLAIPQMGSAIPALSDLQVAGSIGISSMDSIGVPSECLQLKNMFDPAKEMDPDFDLDIKEDVQEECSKFGDLKHIYVDKNSAGVVYLRFGSTQSAMGAQRSLHGRWFAGKMITASYMLPQIYEAKFPESSI